MIGAACTRRESVLALLAAAAGRGLAQQSKPSALAPAPAGVPRAPDPGTLYVRRDVANFTEWDSLRLGVKVMMGRDKNKTDPTSWYYQAAIHGTGDADIDNLGLWNQCQHGSFYFLAWHRMYLYWFERILRKASGNSALTLPYWNYSSPNEQQLPIKFVCPNDPTSNSLYVAGRDKRMNQPDAGRNALPNGAGSYDAAFCFTNFDSPQDSCASFGGQRLEDGTAQDADPPYGALEAAPHQLIHQYVGGSSGLMTNVLTAAQDPIFFVHHANIDRLWELWRTQRGGTNSTDPTWPKQAFTFVDENGKCQTMHPPDVLDTVKQLGYTYEAPADPPPQLPAYPDKCPCIHPVRPESLNRHKKQTLFTFSRRFELRDDTAQLKTPVKTSDVVDMFGRGAGRKLVLELDNLVLQKPSVDYELYLNPPAGGRPDFRSPSYVGVLGFFGGVHHHGSRDKRPLSVVYDLTPAFLRVMKDPEAKGGAVAIAIAPLRYRSGADPLREIPATGGIDIARMRLILVTT